MTRLDEFLGPLHEGVWEVTVPRDQVTEPLDEGWERSPINVPSPGTIASYRKGRYHVHETAGEWKVHLDNHDPKKHPVLHLVDDAPLLLMIGDTFVTLLAGTRARKGGTREILEGQEQAWRQQVVIGIVVILAGAFIITSPVTFFSGLFGLVIPLLIAGIGVLTVYRGFKPGPGNLKSRRGIYQGIAIVLAGIIALFLPVRFWAFVILLVLAIWMFASAIMLLARARKGRSAVPEGFASRLVIALISLALVVLIVIDPRSVLVLLMLIIGVIAGLLGLMLVVNGFRLRQRMAPDRSP